MANHMAEVAKILGVEIGEEFEIDYGGSYVTLSAKVTDTGFHIIDSNNLEFSGLFLNLLLSGQLEIKRKPWKPNDGEIYFCVHDEGNVIHLHWSGCTEDLFHYKLGNCYKTYKEAEANRDKWIAFYASDEVLEV